MYQLFIGLDVSKASLDCAVFQKKVEYVQQFDNSLDGCLLMVERLKELYGIPPSKWLVVFENTGNYSRGLTEWLACKQIPFVRENALVVARTLGIRRGKNDKADAKFLAQYAFEKQHTLQPTVLANDLLVSIKDLLSLRKLVVKQKKALAVSLKERTQNNAPLPLECQIGIQDLIEQYDTQIQRIDKQIQETIYQDEQLKKNYQLCQSVVGIGPIIAAYLVAYTNNFTSFSNARKFASYCGVAPFLHHQSGVKKGTHKVSHLANKTIKTLLGMGARAAIQYDPEMRLYQHRKLEEGKHPNLIMNNVKNKLIQRAFAVVKRQEEYVKLMSYAS